MIFELRGRLAPKLNNIITYGAYVIKLVFSWDHTKTMISRKILDMKDLLITLFYSSFLGIVQRPRFQEYIYIYIYIFF